MMSSRRSLMMFAIGAGPFWLARRMSFLLGHPGGVRDVSGRSALLAMCSRLAPAQTIGRACVAALPPNEASHHALTKSILETIAMRSNDLSADIVAKAVRERSRDDFREGKVMIVDGWMLSLIEIRVYALTTLLSIADRPEA